MGCGLFTGRRQRRANTRLLRKTGKIFPVVPLIGSKAIGMPPAHAVSFKARFPRFTACPGYGSLFHMPAKFSVAHQLHNLPHSASFTLADGTSLTATVRPSTRARRTKLTLDPRGNLVLTVPACIRPEQIENSLPLFQPWLERTWKKRLKQAKAQALPAAITLPLTGQTYMVETGGDMAAGRLAAVGTNAASLLEKQDARRVLVVETPGLLRIFGAVEDDALCARALRQWCRKTATQLLPQYLEALARKGGFALSGIAVRDQRSRWGSCSRIRPTGQRGQQSSSPQRGRARSLQTWTARIRNFFSEPSPPPDMDADMDSDMTALAASYPPPLPPDHASPAGRINLNWRALLLPLPLLEHLCWHELCHLRHMNHSPAYRKELGRYSPLWPEQEKGLNKAWRELPWWALPGDDAS